MAVITDTECVCNGTGLVTTLTEGGGNTGPEPCRRCLTLRKPIEELCDAAEAVGTPTITVGEIRRAIGGTA